MKHTPPPLVFPASAVLSIRKTEKLSDSITAVSGTEVVSHVSDKQRMLQSLMSHWKLILALSSSILFSRELDISEQNTVFLSSPGVIQVAFVLLGVPKYLQWPRCIRG